MVFEEQSVDESAEELLEDDIIVLIKALNILHEFGVFLLRVSQLSVDVIIEHIQRRAR